MARIVGVLAALLLACGLTACSSADGPRSRSTTPDATSRTPTTGTSPASTSPKAGLPVDHYSANVFLCGDVSPDAHCRGRTTTGQTETVRRRLLADPTVTLVRYLGQRDTFVLAQAENPGGAGDLLQPGDLPATFLVSFRGSDVLTPAFRTAYQALPGVGPVVACGTNPSCSVPYLRRLGVIA